MLAPTCTVMRPEVPLVAFPVTRSRSPDDPLVATPVLNTMWPVYATLPADSIVIAPLEVTVLAPLRMEMDPPELVEPTPPVMAISPPVRPWPAVMDTAPPVPDADVLPPVTRTSPALPLAVSPTLRRRLPAAPEVDLPTSKLTEPDVDTAVPDSSVNAPLVPLAAEFEVLTYVAPDAPEDLPWPDCSTA